MSPWRVGLVHSESLLSVELGIMRLLCVFVHMTIVCLKRPKDINEPISAHSGDFTSSSLDSRTAVSESACRVAPNISHHYRANMAGCLPEGNDWPSLFIYPVLMVSHGSNLVRASHSWHNVLDVVSMPPDFEGMSKELRFGAGLEIVLAAHQDPPASRRVISVSSPRFPCFETKHW